MARAEQLVSLPTEDAALTRLHEVATIIGTDFTRVFTPEATPYEQLIKG